MKPSFVAIKFIHLKTSKFEILLISSAIYKTIKILILVFILTKN